MVATPGHFKFQSINGQVLPNPTVVWETESHVSMIVNKLKKRGMRWRGGWDVRIQWKGILKPSWSYLLLASLSHYLRLSSRAASPHSGCSRRSRVSCSNWPGCGRIRWQVNTWDAPPRHVPAIPSCLSVGCQSCHLQGISGQISPPLIKVYVLIQYISTILCNSYDKDISKHFTKSYSHFYRYITIKEVFEV